jgi:hypothetical protein
MLYSACPIGLSLYAHRHIQVSSCALIAAILTAAGATNSGLAQDGATTGTQAGAKVDLAPPPAATGEPERYSKDDGRWHIEFHPGIWYPGLSGEVKLPREGGNEGATPAKADDLNLTQSRVSPFGELNITKGNWLILGRGFGFSIERDFSFASPGNIGDVDLLPGEAYSNSVDAQAFELIGGYRLLERNISPMTGGGHKLSTALYGLAGARLINFEYSVQQGSTFADSADATSVHPLIGLKFNADFYNDFTVHAEVNGGTSFFGDDSFGLDIVVGGQWRPIEHVGVQIGYRALFFGIESGDDGNTFEWSDGAFQGLYAGVTFSF